MMILLFEIVQPAEQAVVNPFRLKVGIAHRGNMAETSHVD
jgi:hypothetical protein